MESQSLNSATNKRILWDILKDNNVFDNMKNSQYNAVKNTFDAVVLNASNMIDRSFRNYSHIEKNKLIVDQLIPAIEKIRTSNKKSSQTSASSSNPSMKVIYDANELGSTSNHPLFHVKKSEQSEYNMKQYNEQKRERELSLDKIVPSEIDFSDKSLENDSPIGNEMDRLIAERLASRERELSIFPPPSPSIEYNNERISQKEEKKSVKFASDVERSYDNVTGTVDNINVNNSSSSRGIPDQTVDQINTSPLKGSSSSKLKLKRQERTPGIGNASEVKTTITETEYSKLLERIIKLEKQISILQSSIQTSSIVSDSNSSAAVSEE